MRLGIMQPYFFPYLGHFALISKCDKWIVFDVTQYTRKTWMNRNRILHPKQGWNYISIPLANASTSIATSDARILSFVEVLPRILGKISHYRKTAPFYASVERLIREVFAFPTDSLVALNVRALEFTCRYLDIRFDYSIASKLDLDLSSIDHPGGWAPAISRHAGASAYMNPVGGSSLFRLEDFDAVGVRLEFIEFGTFVYHTAPYEFQDGLSILDVMMWNDPKTIRSAIASKSRIIDSREFPRTLAPA